MEKHGWELKRISGKHYIMTKPGFRAIPVPVHGQKDLPNGTLAAILKQAEIKGEGK